MDGTPFVYLTRWHTTSDFEPKRREWFRGSKSAELLKLGFLSVQAYEADAFPNGCNLYEIGDLSVFQQPEYFAMRERDAFVPKAMKNFTYNSKTIYEQRIVADGHGRDLSPAPRMAGGTLSLLYFSADDAASVDAWFRERVVAPARDGVRTVRLWETSARHPLHSGTEAHWCAAIEWTDGTDDDGSLLKDAAAHGRLDVARSDVLRKWFG